MHRPPTLPAPPLPPPPATAADKWQVQFEPQAKWANPLIGWTSTADPSDNVYRALSFDSQQAAVAFAGQRRIGAAAALNGWGCRPLPSPASAVFCV